MKELIDWLEKAEGPSRELDAAIECEMRRFQAYEVGLNDAQRSHWSPYGLKGEVIDHQGFTRYHAPTYTFSIDSALALVPEGERVDLKREGHAEGSAYACVWGPHGNRSTRARTLPLALCIAALRARAGKEGE